MAHVDFRSPRCHARHGATVDAETEPILSHPPFPWESRTVRGSRLKSEKDRNLAVYVLSLLPDNRSSSLMFAITVHSTSFSLTLLQHNHPDISVMVDWAFRTNLKPTICVFSNTSGVCYEQWFGHLLDIDEQYSGSDLSFDEQKFGPLLVILMNSNSDFYLLFHEQQFGLLLVIWWTVNRSFAFRLRNSNLDLYL